MKKILLSVLSIFSLSLSAQLTISKDLSFGNNGTLTFTTPSAYYPDPSGSEFDRFNDHTDLILPDGSYIFSNIGLAEIYKYTPEGILDTSFAEGGVLKIPEDLIKDYVFDVMPQGDKILVFSMYDYLNFTPSMSDKALILRYNSNGSLDTTFADNGKFTTVAWTIQQK